MYSVTGIYNLKHFVFRYQNSFYGVDLSNLREPALEEYFRQPIVVSFKFIMDIQGCSLDAPGCRWQLTLTLGIWKKLSTFFM